MEDVLNREVSEVDVENIVNIFKLTDLDDVYMQLGLQQKDQEDAKLSDTDDSPETQAQNILHLWRNRNGVAATRGVLLEAMENCRDSRASFNTLKRKWNMPTLYRGISASSQRNGNHGPNNARLDHDGAWSASTNDDNQWIQMDFGYFRYVNGISLQGRSDRDEWVTTFKVQYSTDGVHWAYVKSNDDDVETVFDGNSDRNSLVTIRFKSAIFAAYIRIRPLEWHGHISLRFGLFEVPDKREKELWKERFPVNGQGTLIFNTERKGSPFFISVEDSEKKRGDNWMALHVGKGFAAFLRYKDANSTEELCRVSGDKFGVDEEKVSYWYSYDRVNLVLKYGKGYRMEETTLMEFDFLKGVSDPEKIREDMKPFFNAERPKWVKQYGQAPDDKLSPIKLPEPLVEFEHHPLICNIPPKVLDSSKVTLFHLDRGDFVFSASLPAACRELYENIKGCKLDYSENPKWRDISDAIVHGMRHEMFMGEEFMLSDAIRYSLKQGMLRDKLKEKQGELSNDPRGTYLRVTLGSSLGKSPGIPYVLEIWPAGHFSPVLNHGNASAVIKVLHGSLIVNIYNKQTGNVTLEPLQKHKVHENDIVWIDRNWYQTHKLENIHATEFCATIQCYKYAPNDTVYWPNFQYLSEDKTIEEFFPNSDFEFLKMRTEVMAEYKKFIEKERTAVFRFPSGRFFMQASNHHEPTADLGGIMRWLHHPKV